MADIDLSPNMIELATELTIAWLNNPNNRAGAEDVPAFLNKMHATLTGLSAHEEQPGETSAETGIEPAVSVRKSLASKDVIISLIDGKPYKSLKRHLSRHGLTPEQYRERYKLKPDYPMVAENYAKQRRDLALKIGLGSKGRAARTGAKTPGRPGRKPAAKGE
ncbi:transcriptional regulator [Sphingomonas changnyeongensis]|uniref:Transcriptional regulator n=1 Tax=Sphingomonas changnyeongensis TaxID=2698679 RepID=A0A7Z2NXG6_9SPHN|nr:MucR family transcriptional regulator [Sphingomonas changnyeongensis]QHL91039.1 transcriptional regulator [Sphingomonas changnyeongensis]